MRRPDSLQGRLALAIGAGLALIWIATAWYTAGRLRAEMDRVFDSALEETAQRILPLAVMDIIEREEEGLSQRISTLRPHDERFTYLVRDARGRVLMRSHTSEDAVFPPYDGTGFRQTATHRLYYDAALRGSITIAVAEPLRYRTAVARETEITLATPLLIMVPLSFVGVFVVVRLGLRPVLRFRDTLARRGAGDLSPVAGDDLPQEIRPLARALNQLLGRLREAFEAERSFAANAAHEIRTPIAAALALSQRLVQESADPAVAERVADIRTSLERLNRLSGKLMQLARVEGGRLHAEAPTDVRAVLRLLVAEFTRASLEPANGIELRMPPGPVLVDIDADAFAILCRNLVENALRHGAPERAVQVGLEPDGSLHVANEGPIVPADDLQRLTARFERGTTLADGSGLGLSIVRAVANGIGGTLVLRSPRRGHADGFEAVVRLPVAA